MELEPRPLPRTERTRALVEAIGTVLAEHQDSLLLLESLCTEPSVVNAEGGSPIPDCDEVRERLKRSAARRKQLIAELVVLLPPSESPPA